MKLESLMPSIGTMVDTGYETIKNDVYEGIIERLLADAKVCECPNILQVSGMPGAGKSTFCRENKSADSIFVSFDAVMEQIPDYHKDINSIGPEGAFKTWEMMARIMGYELLRRAVEKKANILLEHSGVNDAHIELFQNVKKLGYKTEVNFIVCEIEEAYRRILEREKIEKRHTPRKLLDERTALIDAYIEKYKKIADDIVIFDTTTHRPVRKNF